MRLARGCVRKYCRAPTGMRYVVSAAADAADGRAQVTEPRIRWYARHGGDASAAAERRQRAVIDRAVKRWVDGDDGFIPRLPGRQRRCGRKDCKAKRQRAASIGPNHR